LADRLSKSGFIFWVLFLLLLALAYGLRASAAFSRPLHADEAVQAYTTAELQTSGEYKYTAEDRHGPTLYYIAAWLNELRGLPPNEIEAFDLRLVPIGFSLAALLALPFILREQRDAAFLAGAILATSPLAVIYGSYFIQESIFLFFSLLLLFATHRLFLMPSLWAALLLGLSAGMLQATKETAVLVYAAVALSLILGALLGKMRFGTSRGSAAVCLPPLRSISIAIVSALVVFVAFQSSFFTSFDDVQEAFAAYIGYLDRAGGQGHEKPFGYYWSLFMPHASMGLPWGELPLLALLIVCAVWRIVSSCRSACFTIGFHAALSGLFLALAYSLIPYKTPWLFLVPLAFLVLASGELAAERLASIQSRKLRISVTIIAILAIVGLEARVTARVAGRYAAHENNPYIYSHTTGQYNKLIGLIETLTKLEPDAAMAVVSPDNAWPLPWNLRNRENVGYWTQWNPQIENIDLVLLDSRLEIDPSVHDTLSETHVPELHGLRPNTLLYVYIEQTLWEDYLETR